MTYVAILPVNVNNKHVHLINTTVKKRSITCGKREKEVRERDGKEKRTCTERNIHFVQKIVSLYKNLSVINLSCNSKN